MKNGNLNEKLKFFISHLKTIETKLNSEELKICNPNIKEVLDNVYNGINIYKLIYMNNKKEIIKDIDKHKNFLYTKNPSCFGQKILCNYKGNFYSKNEKIEIKLNILEFIINIIKKIVNNIIATFKDKKKENNLNCIFKSKNNTKIITKKIYYNKQYNALPQLNNVKIMANEHMINLIKNNQKEQNKNYKHKRLLSANNDNQSSIYKLKLNLLNGYPPKPKNIDFDNLGDTYDYDKLFYLRSRVLGSKVSKLSYKFRK